MNEVRSVRGAEVEVTPLTKTAIKKLIFQISTLQGCKDLFTLDGTSGLTSCSPEGRHLISVMLKECRDDIPLLCSVCFGDDGYHCCISDAAFERILSLCGSVGMLHLLYIALPGEPEPGTDDNWHEKVVIAMIERCDGDIKQLSKLLAFFGKVPSFRNLIHAEINKTSKVFSG